MHFLAEHPELICALALFAGAFVAGFAGFGLAAVAGGVLLQFQPPATAVPLMMVCSVFSQVGGLVVLRSSVEWRRSFPFILGGFLGVPIALVAFHRIDAVLFANGFGAFLMIYAGHSLVRMRGVPRSMALAGGGGSMSLALNFHPASPPVVGFAAGIVGGLTAMPGILVTIWCDLHRCSKESQRGVLQPFILAMQILALVLTATDPRFANGELLQVLLVSLPFVAAGTGLGLHLFGRVSNGGFRMAVLSLVLVSGTVLLVR